MRKEHTVYFKVIRNGETKRLRGLIYLEEGTEPTAQDFEQCLKDCGHEVQLIDPEHFIYRAYQDGEEYLIDVLEDYRPNTRDRNTENLAKTFMKTDPLL